MIENLTGMKVNLVTLGPISGAVVVSVWLSVILGHIYRSSVAQFVMSGELTNEGQPTLVMAIVRDATFTHFYV